ncbi:MAG: hypothetical protein ACLQGN_19960 [Mycobacterium sp.]|uniref:hypothetical protein n=1 Tax=Mycobacterium sp. TaxID=1785 RepID=UPI003F99198E
MASRTAAWRSVSIFPIPPHSRRAGQGGVRTCYVRGNARTLPFADETFDAVC